MRIIALTALALAGTPMLERSQIEPAQPLQGWKVFRCALWAKGDGYPGDLKMR